MHSGDMTPEARAQVHDLALAVADHAAAAADAEILRRSMKSTAVRLVRHEILSQARAARICGVTRATISEWLDKEPWPDEIDL